MTWWDSITRPLTTGDLWDMLPEREPEFWPPFDGPLDKIPVGHAQMLEAFGDPAVTYDRHGKVKVSRRWEYRNLHTVPAALIPGYDRRLYMHRVVAPYFREAMRRAVLACPDYEFRKIGCFNPRHMRFDRSRPLSLHTWAIAYDINDDMNHARTLKRDDPRPFEPGWEEFSDLPQGVVEAFESVGFEWGGRWDPWTDPMHLQLCWTRGEAKRRRKVPPPLPPVD